MRDVPYFPLYASNILASKHYRLMNLQERGLWISIFMECWPNISVPKDLRDLTAYLRARDGEISQQSLNKVLEVFQASDNQVYSQELENQRREFHERRAKQSAGGSKGAERKKQKARMETTELGAPEGIPEGQSKGSLNQLNSTQISSNQILSKKEVLLYEELNNDEDGEVYPF